MFFLKYVCQFIYIIQLNCVDVLFSIQSCNNYSAIVPRRSLSPFDESTDDHLVPPLTEIQLDQSARAPDDVQVLDDNQSRTPTFESSNDQINLDKMIEITKSPLPDSPVQPPQPFVSFIILNSDDDEEVPGITVGN